MIEIESEGMRRCKLDPTLLRQRSAGIDCLAFSTVISDIVVMERLAPLILVLWKLNI